MSMLLDRLEGRIADVDFDLKADLETRVVLQRHLLRRLGHVAELAPLMPYPVSEPRRPWASLAV